MDMKFVWTVQFFKLSLECLRTLTRIFPSTSNSPSPPYLYIHRILLIQTHGNLAPRAYRLSTNHPSRRSLLKTRIHRTQTHPQHPRLLRLRIRHLVPHRHQYPLQTHLPRLRHPLFLRPLRVQRPHPQSRRQDQAWAPRLALESEPWLRSLEGF